MEDRHRYIPVAAFFNVVQVGQPEEGEGEDPIHRWVGGWVGGRRRDLPVAAFLNVVEVGQPEEGEGKDPSRVQIEVGGAIRNQHDGEEHDGTELEGLSFEWVGGWVISSGVG